MQQWLGIEDKSVDTTSSFTQSLDALSFLLIGLIVVLLLVSIILLILRWKPYLHSRLYPHVYEQYDILELSLIYHRCRMYHESILFGLLSLYNQGLIRMFLKSHSSIEMRKLRFALTDSFDYDELSEDEQYLVDWLFEHRDGNECYLSSIAGPAPSEKRNTSRFPFYKERLEELDEDWDEWTDLVYEQWDVRAWMDKAFSFKRVILWLGLLCVLLCFMLFVNEYSFIEACVIMWGNIVVIGFSFIVAALTDCKRCTLVVYTVLESIFCWLLIGFDNPNTILTMTMFLCCLLLLYTLPANRKQMEYKQLLHFKQRLMHETYQPVDDPQYLEYLIQASMVLECSEEFMNRHADWIQQQAEQYRGDHTFLTYAKLMVQAEQELFALYPMIENWRPRRRRYSSQPVRYKSQPVVYESDCCTVTVECDCEVHYEVEYEYEYDEDAEYIEENDTYTRRSKDYLSSDSYTSSSYSSDSYSSDSSSSSDSSCSDSSSDSSSSSSSSD
ncbi:hypothetical protein [Paenibacillus kandeliae]|uniref:hypothetical protein n=1 Tax=Paenibacillus kandeliae TaxID=3231269 RepID=UPI0034582944